MDEGKKSGERGNKESSRSGEEPDSKGGTVDDEEGTESTDINGREKEVEEKPFRKSENEKCDDREKCEDKEKRKDDVQKEAISETEKDNDGKRTKQKNKEGKKDEAERSVNKDETGDCKDKSVKEVKEEEVLKDVIGNEKSREVLQVADDNAHETEVQKLIDKDNVGLKMFSVEYLPSKEGNIQLETADHTATMNNQDSVTYKEEAGIEVKMASGNIVQSNNQAASSKEIISEQGKKTNEVPKIVEHPSETAVDRTQQQYVTDKSMLTDSLDHDKEKQKEDIKISENMNKELKKEEVPTEVHKEKPYKENDVTEKERKMEDERTVTLLNNAVHGMADVEGNVKVSLVSNEVCHTLQKVAKKREELSFTDVDEGQKGMINVTQEQKSKDEAGEMSSSKETMKYSVRTETAAGKQEHWKTQEKEENEANSKAKKEINIKDFNDTEKERREECENKEQQKEPNDDERMSDLNYKAANLTMEVTPELSAQKSVDKVTERSQEKQTCTSQETTVKLNEKHTAKNSKTLASEIILPHKKSHESDQSRGILDMSVTEKPICTVFQGTITRNAKCEESVQRSDITHSSQNQVNNKVKAGNSFSTEAAISDQLKQLECKFQQSTQEKPTPLKPQPLRQQTQQMQQKQIQEQQQEQNQMKQKQQQEEKMPAQRNEQQQQQQKTQNRHKKEEKEQAGQEQIQQTQQPLKHKIQKTQKHEEKQCTQQNQQLSVIEVQAGIHEQKLVEHKKQRQPQTNEKSQQKQQEQKTEKQLKQEIKQENEEQQWQPEPKCKQQHIQSHKQEKETDSKGQLKQENQQQQQFQSVKQPQQETTQQKQSKWPQQEQHKKHQKPKDQQHKQPKQQAPKQMTQEQEEEKQKQQSRPDKGHHQQEQQPTQQSEEGEDDSVPGCGGTQGRSCPIFFGVKSYLHHFYDSAPVKDSQLYEDYTEVSHSFACRINARFTEEGNCFLLWRERDSTAKSKITVHLSLFTQYLHSGTSRYLVIHSVVFCVHGDL